MKPLCFVLMPFGIKPDPGGRGEIDFDRIYEEGILPAIKTAELDAIRADEEKTGGIIHRAMFERLLLCDFAVADLTTGNPNVFYELGVRHAVRPRTTLALRASGQRIPFDVTYLRLLTYDLGDDNVFDEGCAARMCEILTARLIDLRKEAREGDSIDSPLFQLLTEYRAPEVARLKTDTFRKEVSYAKAAKARLADIRRGGDSTALREYHRELRPLDAQESGVLVDLLLSYRALSDWEGMITLQDELPLAVRRSVLVREQLGLALNRAGQPERALEVLQEVIDDQGPSSETCGIIGRVYKDQWQRALERGETVPATGMLDKAIASYRAGYRADMRDHYPGVNLVTLLDIKGDETSLDEKDHTVDAVRFAVELRLRHRDADYWDQATLLELDVLAGERERAMRQLPTVVAAKREGWEAETTARNLRLIRDAWESRGVDTGWLEQIIAELERAAKA